MKIPLLTIRALAGELNDRLAGRTVTAVGRLERGDGLSLTIGPGNRGDRLVISARPELFVPFLVRTTDPMTGAGPAGPLLEDHLRGGTIRKAACWRHDRIVRLELVRTDEIRGPIRRDLILELVPRRQNIILLETDRDTILFALRQVDRKISRTRQVISGKPYQPPPRPPGLQPGVDPVEHFLGSFGEADDDRPEDRFTRLFPWASPYLFDELLAPLSISPDDRKLTAGAWRALWDHLGSWITRLDQGPMSPTLILDDHQRPRWLLPYDPGAVPEERKRRFDHLSQALEEIFYRRIGGGAGEEKKTALLRQISIILHRRRRARKHLDIDLERALRADRYHHAGVILMAHLSRLRKGRSRVTLTDPADPSREIEITLDARLGPAENARRYFQRSRKARAALPRVKQRILRLDEEIDGLIALRKDLSGTTDEEQLEAAKIRLKGLDAGPSPAAHHRPGRTASDATGGDRGGREETRQQTVGRKYTLPEGWLVLVGRNNKENDELTHRVARPDDLWLHAQGVPGSHVIIRQAGHKDVPGRRITELAAGLAAHFSRARNSGTVPVIVTEKRYVRKPRGAKPGAAAVEREKTLFVAPLSPEGLQAEMDK